MTRCPKTARPSQFRGRAKYRFAGVTFQCVLEAGHAGPCGMEPLPQAPPIVTGSIETTQAEINRGGYIPAKPQTPEQIAAGDARYRDMLRRRRAR